MGQPTPAHPLCSQPVAVPSGRMREAVNRIAETLPDRAAVVLDVGAVDYVGSEDLGTLVVLHKRAKGAGGRLAPVNVGPAVSDVFTLTRLDTLIEVRWACPKAAYRAGGNP